MNIIEWDGKPISVPGIYANIPMAAYHGQLTVGPSISSSGCRKIESESPAHYFVDSYLNPDRVEREDSEAFAVGRAAHLLFGGESGFHDQFVVRPDKWDSWRTADAKAWRAEQWMLGKTVLEAKHLEIIRGMAASLGRHPTIQAGIMEGEIEKSIVWQDAQTGVWLKARPDCLPIGSNMIVDLKTCASADPISVRRAVADCGYHMQLALAYEGLKAVAGREMTDFVLVFVEKSAPYAVNIKPIHENAIWNGRRQLRRAILRFAECVKLNNWPGYDDDEVPCDLPDYYRKRLEEQDAANLLPQLEDAA